MAANMMEILQQINRNINTIEGKVSELDKKMDQQEITIYNLEQQVKKNNTFLFGNDETDILLENYTTNKTDLVNKKKKADMVDESQEYIGHAEIKLLQNPSAILLNRMCQCQTEANCEYDNKTNDDKNIQHIVLESITNELREIKDFLRDFGATMKIMSLHKDNVLQMSPTYSNADQISKLREELKRDCDEAKDLIKDSGATNKVSGDAVSTDKKQEEKEEVKKKDEEIFRISPAYFSADQISKLNEELKRIAKIYRSTNTFPIIEVLPGGQEHPVMLDLREGVRYKKYWEPITIKIKLGVDGYKSSEVQEMLDEYPDLTLAEVAKELLKSRGWTVDELNGYHFPEPLEYENEMYPLLGYTVFTRQELAQ